MPRSVYVLNTTNFNRAAIVTCGFPFEKGEVTSTSQVLTERGALSIPSLNYGPFTQKVQWTPFGVNHNDGSYRYAKVVFRTEIGANAENKSIITVGSNPFISVPYDNNNLTKFLTTTINVSINGQLVTLPTAEFVLQGTASSEDHIRRYKLFKRPFASMPWVWVEMVIDIPKLGITTSTGSAISSLSMDTANFWFMFGNSYAQRGLGRNPGTYTTQQRNFYLTDYVKLEIIGAESIIRFDQQIYSKQAFGTQSSPANRYILADPFYNGTSNNANNFKYSTSRAFRGCMFFSNPAVSTQIGIERLGEIAAVAEGWNQHMPPAFTDVPTPPNVAQPSDSNARTDWITKISTMLTRDGLGRLRPLPFPSTPYGIKPNAPGTGDQGMYGNAFHNNPLYYTMKSACAKELPYMINGGLSHAHRPTWMREADGTIWKQANYPGALIWYSELFFTGDDYCGVYQSGPTAQAVKSSEPYEDWNGQDRQHSSLYLDVVIAIMTADYYMLNVFCENYAELYAATARTDTNSGSINGWDADRAAGRIMMSLISLYYATANPVAFKGLISRYWLGYVLKEGWERDGAGGIEKLKFIDVIGSNVYPVISYRNQVDTTSTIVASGALFQSYYPETPHITPWQQSFVAIAYYQVAKAIKDLYPNGAYMTTSGVISTTDPGGNRMLIDQYLARRIARDLAATVTMYCTHKYGPGSTIGWDYLGVGVTSRTGVSAGSAQRALECWPIGGTVTGATTGTRGTIMLVEAGDDNNLNSPTTSRVVKIHLKDVTGPGFQNNGPHITEHLLSSSGYNSMQYSSLYVPAFTNSGWHGCAAYCIDRGGTANGSTTGANYRKPLTKEQMEATDFRGQGPWDNYTSHGPIWIKMYRDYGIWQSVCAAIAIEGVKEGYYTSSDPVNTVAALLSKAKSIMDYWYAVSTVETEIWDQKIWPYAAISNTFLDNGAVVLTPSVVVNIAALPQPTVVTSSTFGRTITPQPVVNFAVTPSVTIYATQAIDVTTQPPVIQDDAVIPEPMVSLSYSASIATIDNTAVLPEALAIATQTPVGPKINAIIFMSMSGPGSGPRTDPVSLPPDTVPDIPPDPPDTGDQPSNQDDPFGSISL